MSDWPGAQKRSQIQTLPPCITLVYYVFPQDLQLGVWCEESWTPLCYVFGEPGKLGQQKHHS